MERYLRFYIKFQGYIIAVTCLLFTVLITLVIFFHNPFHYPGDEISNYRYVGNTAMTFGVLWFIVGTSMLYGIFKEDQKFLYPFAVMFMFDLFLLFSRDVVQIWRNQPWSKIILLNPMTGLSSLFLTMHITMTLVALGKLFKHEPLAPAGTNFVRFKTENQRNGNDYIEDEVSLVTE